MPKYVEYLPLPPSILPPPISPTCTNRIYIFWDDFSEGANPYVIRAKCEKRLNSTVLEIVEMGCAGSGGAVSRGRMRIFFALRRAGDGCHTGFPRFISFFVFFYFSSFSRFGGSERWNMPWWNTSFGSAPSTPGIIKAVFNFNHRIHRGWFKEAYDCFNSCISFLLTW